ncbi:hypothetical protein GQ53DRAFT_722881 [Thozetella sp. PMI_491]|nr:hypothetical protein GQ53DRAFT_722881 [Thozetella sp. PMI_491]
MLARRLPAPQFFPSQLGIIARHVTTRSLSSKSSLRSSKKGASLAPPTPPTTSTPSRTSLRDGGGPAGTTTGFGDDAKRLKANDSQRRNTDGKGGNPLSWETYLENEAGFALPGNFELDQWDRIKLETRPESDPPKETSRAALLNITGVSNSLLESDFYRLAPQGKHLDGWAGGIHKVIQAHHSVTREPLGQYFLFFNTLPAAEAYSNNLTRLHTLARHALPDTWKPAAGVATGLPLGDDAAAAESVRAFTLVPPSAKLRVRSFTSQNLRDEIRRLKETEKARLKITGRERDAPARERVSAVEGLLRQLESLDEGEDGAVLGKQALYTVLLRLDGSKTTPQAILAAIKRDGRERNLPWRLDEQAEAIVPLQASGTKVKFSVYNEQAGEDQVETAFTRFLVNFVEASEARRFVRDWHKRELLDERTDRLMIVNTTALWESFLDGSPAR